MRTIQGLLKRRKILRTSDITTAGIDPRRIAAAVEEGVLVRPEIGGATLMGIYTSPEADYDEDRDACLAMVLTGGILCRQYAAQRHNLATCLPDAMEVMVPHKVRLAPKAWFRLHRVSRKESLTVGIETRKTDLGIPIRITSEARTVVDLLRMRDADGDSYRHGHEALATFLSKGGKVADLMETAKHFEAWVPDMIEIASSAIGEHLTR